MLVDHDAHRLRGVSRSVPELQLHLAEGVTLTVGDGDVLELGFGDGGVDDLGAGRLGQFEVTGEEVGMEVRLYDQFDGHTKFLGIGDVLADVALRIDDNGATAALVADQVRRMRQTFEVVLIELHGGVLRVQRTRVSELTVFRGSYTSGGISALTVHTPSGIRKVLIKLPA